MANIYHSYYKEPVIRLGLGHDKSLNIKANKSAT